MLEVAKKHQDKLTQRFYDIRFNDYYKFFSLSSYYSDTTYSADDWNEFNYVGVDKHGEPQAMFRAWADRDSMVVTELSLVNFGQSPVDFYSDFKMFITRLIDVGMRMVCFSVAVGNPAEKTYDRFIKRYGGRIVGTHKEHAKLIDGKYYDIKMYEIRTDILKGLLRP